MIILLFIFMCLVTSNINHKVDGMHSTLNEDLDLERQLKMINKSPIKSIHTKFGDIIDCIDIYKQPAFDHPLLKNHKLQMKPSFQGIFEKSSIKNSSSKLIFGIHKDMCPTETVPIRRTTKDDLLRAKSLMYNYTLAENNLVSHVAQVSLKNVPGNPYYGVSGVNSIWNPRVSEFQTSSSNMWVQNGDGGVLNKIAVGWHVSPQLHGNAATHVYSFWTSDNFKKTGCYNTLCPGFVQVPSPYAIGNRVDETSVYGGYMTEMKVSIFQDRSTKNWWVNIEDQSVGYFPAALFNNLDVASQVGWGGRTITPSGTPGPEMGSGRFPDTNFNHACYYKQVSYRDSFLHDNPPGVGMVEQFSDVPNCYGVDNHDTSTKEIFGYNVHFGGPGGAC